MEEGNESPAALTRRAFFNNTKSKKRFSMKKIIPVLLLAFSLSSCAYMNKQADIAEQKRAARFTVSMRSPQVPAGQIEAQFNRAFPATGITKRNVTVTYFPYEDAVCLQFRSNTVTYNQFWHRPARVAFLASLNKYNGDFSAQRLRNRNTKTKSQYGKAENCYVVWQMYSFSERGNGNMEIELGYYFREGSPFFAVTQMPALFESPSLDREKNEMSPEIPIFFTRAQADELAALFDQEYLQGLAPEIRPAAPQGSGTDVEFDGY
jgi:hypothetical protein